MSPGVPGASCENAGALGSLQQLGWVTTLEPEPPRSAEAGAQSKHVPGADPSFSSPPSGVESVRTGDPAGRPRGRGSPCKPAGPGWDSGGVCFLEVFVCKSLGSQVHSEAKASCSVSGPHGPRSGVPSWQLRLLPQGRGQKQSHDLGFGRRFVRDD